MRKPLEFSIFFFSAHAGVEGGDPYRLLRRAAEFGDGNGFAAIWTPERHFSAFGGPYPNPAVVGAALAAMTRRIGIRAGSVVLPLHDPLRLAEEWAVVDNLSQGRVGLSFAPGWQVNDFALAPAAFARRHEIVEEHLEVFRRLWRGETVTRTSGAGEPVEVRSFPRPCQAEPPVWLTCQRDESFARAGEWGLNVLTNLNYQRLPDLERKIRLYRETIRGRHRRRGHLTLMAHAYVAGDDADVDRIGRMALTEYLRENLRMQEVHQAGLWATLGVPGGGGGFEWSDQDRAALLDRAVERFVSEAGLIGTEARCHEAAAELNALGVDEIACLIDFGVPVDEAMASLGRIGSILESFRAAADGGPGGGKGR